MHHRPVIANANGTWFIWVVASQSVAVSAASLEPVYRSLRDGLAVVAVFSWSVGVFLYAAAGIFVAARMMLYEFRPADLNPPYWVPWVPAPSPSWPPRGSWRWPTRPWSKPLAV